MKPSLILVLTAMAGATSSACVADVEGPITPRGGSGGVVGAGAGGGVGGDGVGGDGGSSGGGGGTGGAGGMSGAAGSTGNAGAGGGTGLPTPALPNDAPTIACPTVIDGALEATDATQTGRHSRIASASACGTTKTFPGNDADSFNPHLFDVYRFVNAGQATACFTFTLTYGANTGDADAGAEGGGNTGADAGGDAGAPDPGPEPGVVDPGPVPPKYLTAHSTFYPTALELEHRGDVGATLDPPQTMGITVPAGQTIDVVVYAVDVAPAGLGSYTLSCSLQ